MELCLYIINAKHDEGGSQKLLSFGDVIYELPLRDKFIWFCNYKYLLNY